MFVLGCGSALTIQDVITIQDKTLRKEGNSYVWESGQFLKQATFELGFEVDGSIVQHGKGIA